VIEVATTVAFTDDPLVATATAIKAVHITELRVAINAFRGAAGLGPATFTDESLAGKPMRPEHVLELRSALAAARTSAAMPAITFSSPAPASGTFVRAMHLQELRDALK
jgi:hypothetical protein